ncbi:hypothetical protein BJ166DRAFT_624323 [Pestalotiopsis sp. NC0098]|nr:hypothetical protein BJ166DRAFT_624323 [Pestalotiopsis sp. NC0098]
MHLSICITQLFFFLTGPCSHSFFAFPCFLVSPSPDSPHFLRYALLYSERYLSNIRPKRAYYRLLALPPTKTTYQHRHTNLPSSSLALALFSLLPQTLGEFIWDKYSLVWQKILCFFLRILLLSSECY